MRALFALFLLSGGLLADNEIFIDQTGDNAAIDIEQLGSSNNWRIRLNFWINDKSNIKW